MKSQFEILPDVSPAEIFGASGISDAERSELRSLLAQNSHQKFETLYLKDFNGEVLSHFPCAK